MNAEHLKTVLKRLLDDNEEFDIQSSLHQLQSALQNMINVPQDTAAQEAFSKELASAKKQVTAMASWYSPALIKDIENVGGAPFFSEAMIERISSQLAINTITPAVLLNDLNQIIEDRAVFIDNVSKTIIGMTAFGIDECSVDEGEAEIGFRIPRDLFENNLDGLISELRAIRLIIIAFSENTLGRAESVEVRSISTSDPTFFFNLSIETVIALAAE